MNETDALCIMASIYMITLAFLDWPYTLLNKLKTILSKLNTNKLKR